MPTPTPDAFSRGICAWHIPIWYTRYQQLASERKAPFADLGAAFFLADAFGVPAFTLLPIGGAAGGSAPPIPPASSPQGAMTDADVRAAPGLHPMTLAELEALLLEDASENSAVAAGASPPGDSSERS